MLGVVSSVNWGGRMYMVETSFLLVGVIWYISDLGVLGLSVLVSSMSD